MKFSYTTFFGIVGAISLAVANVPGVTGMLKTVCLALSSACIAGIGTYAADGKKPKLPGPRKMILLLVFAADLVITGCKVGGLGVKVNSNTFGTLDLALDGGVIGHGKLQQSLTGTNVAPK